MYHGQMLLNEFVAAELVDCQDLMPEPRNENQGQLLLLASLCTKQNISILLEYDSQHSTKVCLLKIKFTKFWVYKNLLNSKLKKK